MKKGQLLAALALAFALGVVVPVAGVYNSAAAVYAATDEREGASRDEADIAIATVKLNPTYAKFANVIETVDKVEDEQGVKATDKSDVTSAMNALSSALITGKPSFVTLATTGINPTNQTIIDAAAQTTNYSIYAAIYKAIADENVSDLKTALATYNSMAEKDDNYTGVDYSALNKEGAVVADFIVGNLTENTYYDSLYKKITDAQVTLDGYNTAIKELTDVIKPVLADQDTLDGVDTISGLIDLVNNTNMPGYSNWEAVYNKMFDPSNDAAQNWEKIKQLAGVYKTATNNLTDTIEQVAENLIGGTASNPEDPTDPDTPAVNTIKSADGKVSVTGNIPAGVYVEVSPAKMPENFEGFGELKNAAFDIVLKNADGTVYNVDQTLVVSIAVPEGINGANSDVIYITSMGGTENMKAKYADGAMTFTTNHFSIYAIVERAAGDNGGSNVTPGDTGTVAQAEGTASATGILAGIAAALTAAGAGVVAFRNARRNSKKNA